MTEGDVAMTRLEVLEKEVRGKKGYIKDVLDFDIAEIGENIYRHTMIFELEQSYRLRIKEDITKGVVRVVSIVYGNDYSIRDCKFYNLDGVEVKSLKMDAILRYVVLLDVRTFITLYRVEEL